MTNFLIIAICIIAGMLFRQSKTLPEDAHKGINAWLIYLALPAVSFKYLPHVQWSSEILFPAIAPLIVCLGGWITIQLYAAKSTLKQPSVGALKLVTALSNTSFIGFPLIIAYFSEADIAYAVICDQVTFLLLSTYGVVVAVNASKTQKLTAGIIIKKVLSFPPFLGCVTALTIPHFIDISALTPLFDKLSATVGPLALFSIGLQLQLEGWRSEIKNISMSLFYKLMIAPALVMIIALAFQLKGKIIQISIFEMAMPSFLSASVIANQYHLNTKLTNLIIGLSIVIGFITTAFWWYILQYFQ
jgi:malate permease and related proteins